MFDNDRDGATASPQRVVRDPEDFAQMERLRQIYSAREDFRETLAEIDRIGLELEWSTLDKKYRYLQRSYLKYYFELEGLMRKHEDGDFYLNDAFLGVLAKEKKKTYIRKRMGEIDESSLDGDDRVQELRSDLENENGVRVFFGLESLTQFPKPIKTVGYTIDSRTGTRDERGVQVSVPKSAVVRAYRYCNRFLADVGLDADITEETPDAGFEHEDLLGDVGTDAPEMVGDGGQNE